ncbi:hypothetical protein F1640_16285 [Novosphingobium sp. NBM11]|uniref:GDSL-type esterase/lipase family protein n=1 Tax=Novosphingobium sp. NBM11 TaxID=2596914 RepID=UPI001891F7E2|nr:GDSL-type esterase/lipase family protein [Novosphingobium sp. NBM11]MBF5091534.1 hypothetical protein [Novosphingobium sp. NBM11]
MTRISGSIGGQRLRRLPHVAVGIGDSRVDAIYQDGAGTGRNGYNYGAFSPLNWANALMGQRLVLLGQQYGVSGDRTDQMLARIDAAVASGAGLLYIQGGVNDITQQYPSAGTSGATAAANIVTMAEKGRRAGMVVVIEMEVGTGAWTDASRLGQWLELNRRLRDYTDVTPGVYPHDARSIVLDPATASNAIAYRSGYSWDPTHANGRGAYRWGKSLATLLASIVPVRAPLLLASRAEGDVANGRRQLADNPLFTTASGGTLMNGATGTGPQSWLFGPTAAGPTATISTEANAIANAAVCDITFTAAAQEIRYQQSVNLANWQAGDVVQMIADVEIVTPGVLSGVYGTLDINVAGVSKTMYALFSLAGAAYLGPDEACRYTLLTRPFTIPAGAKGWMVPAVRAASSAAGGGKFKVHQCAVLRRADQGM